MTQFNLLPDVKLQYLKAERLRRLVISVSILVAIAAIAVLALLLSVTVLQRKHLSDLNRDIKADSAKIQGQTDINRILTVQNQLGSLTTLHDGKPAASRLAAYLNQVTPAQANIDNLQMDFVQHTVSLGGTADSLSTVNQYVDTLKFTTYKTATNTTATKAFSSVVLTSFGYATHEVSFTITFNYDPTIFDLTQTVTLTVPQQVTTRSEVDKPTDLFKLPEDSTNGTKR